MATTQLRYKTEKEVDRGSNSPLSTCKMHTPMHRYEYQGLHCARLDSIHTSTSSDSSPLTSVCAFSTAGWVCSVLFPILRYTLAPNTNARFVACFGGGKWLLEPTIIQYTNCESYVSHTHTIYSTPPYVLQPQLLVQSVQAYGVGCRAVPGGGQ